MSAAAPGTYTFHIQGIIDRHPNCSNISDHTDTVTITVQVGEADGAQDLGTQSCNEGIGEPVNVTNGNMYLQQSDYRLPGIGSGVQITRTYNSKNQMAGLFGFGWSSILDESIKTYGSFLLRVTMPDNRAVYFSRESTNDPYTPKQHVESYSQVVKNANSTYTLTFKDGSVHQFNNQWQTRVVWGSKR